MMYYICFSFSFSCLLKVKKKNKAAKNNRLLNYLGFHSMVDLIQGENKSTTNNKTGMLKVAPLDFLGGIPPKFVP